MQPSSRGEGISEVIGFVLILAAVIVTLSIYLLYAMPTMGRENEISQMSLVKERFSEFKLDIDTLLASSQRTTAYGPALTLGSGETGGILGFFPFFKPAKADAVLAINQRPEKITIASDSYFLVSSGGLTQTGSIAYTPSGIPANVTPQHFFIVIAATDLLTQRGVRIQGSTWNAWVNLSPNYFGYTQVQLSWNATGKITNFTNATQYQWNSTDITVNTNAGGRSAAADLPVYRNISTSGTYPVDLMSPAYGISTQFQNPQDISVSLSDNTGSLTATYLLTYGYLPSVSSSTWDLGSIEYRSNNIFYTPQTYYYQLGGVFLEQEEGSSNEVPPSIGLSVVNSSPVVKIGQILIQGSVTDANVTGSGPLTVTSAVTDIENAPLLPGNNTKWVSLTIQTASVKAAEMWNRTFRDLAAKGGLPVASYTTGTSGNNAFLYITTNPQRYDIRLSVSQVNVSADYVLEYTSGGISRSWRYVPGFALPGVSTTTNPSGLNTTTTTLGASTTYCNYGTSVTFTATVTGSGGPGTPSGTVTFYNGSVSLGTSTLSSGSASISNSSLPVGTNSVTATYNGDSYYLTSTSNAVQVTVTTPPAGYVTWKDCAWTHRKNITIDKRMVNSTLTNFPVLINFTQDSDLAMYAKSNGQDIFFTQDNGVTVLPHEIELYQNASGGLVAWVNVNQIQNTANTTIYMYYGNPSASPQWQNTSVWSNGYAAVWHLGESGSGKVGEFKDSTSNANNGQGASGLGYGTPVQKAGKIGFAQNFTSESNQFIEVPNTASLQLTDPMTVEAWINGAKWTVTQTGENYRGVIGKQHGSAGDDDYIISMYCDGSDPTTPYTWFTGPASVSDGKIVSTGSWYFIATNLSAGKAVIHVNGVAQGAGCCYSITEDANNVTIGAEETDGTLLATERFAGKIDEVRLSNVARDNSWIWTEYQNQNSPTTFEYRMPQETSSCAPAYVQGQNAKTTGSSVTMTLPGMSTTGNLMVVSVLTESTVTSVTDSKGNTYSLAVGPTYFPSWANASTWYASNINGGGSPITITINVAASVENVYFAAEYSGVSTSSPLDQTAPGYGTSGLNLNSGSRTTTQSSELIFGFLVSKPAQAYNGTSFSQRQENWGHIIEDKTVSSIGLYSADGTQDGDGPWSCQMATFRGK